MTLVVENVKKRFNENIVLDGINVTIKQGEFVCILGKSGCGKSTLLNLLAGFTKPTEGTIKVKGKLIDKPSKERGLVFQEHALFPWQTVLENISFGPSIQGLSKIEAMEKAKKYLKLIHLEEYENHFPSQLSGGMKQRVGIARALAGEPDFLLMDEPFGALDIFTKKHMQNELITIWKELKPTIIFITHDISEAIYLADRIIVLKEGAISNEYLVNLNRPRQYFDEKFGNLAAEIEKTIL